MVSVTPGDYYVEVSVKMSENGLVYIYPLPVEVQLAPDDSTIVTYGFSANVTAGVESVIIVEELESKSSYNLYVSGRGVNNEVSSPSRIVRAITTLARIPLCFGITHSNPSRFDNFRLCRCKGVHHFALLHDSCGYNLVSCLYRRRE